MLGVVFGVAVGLIAIDADGPCPTSGDVATAIAPLLSRDVSAEHVVIHSDNVGLKIEFLDPAGLVTSMRSLAASDDCGERAKVAAVIIAAHQLQLRRDLVLAIPETTPVSESSTPTVTTIRRAAPTPIRRIGFDVAASFISAIAADGSFAPGANGSLMLSRIGERFAGHFAFDGTGRRAILLGSGQALWTRIAISLGAAYRLRLGRWIADVTADGVAALLVVDGAGFAANGNAVNFDPGLALGIRMGYRWHRVMPFVGVGLTGWLRAESVRTAALADRVDLPRLDAQISVGASYGNF